MVLCASRSGGHKGLLDGLVYVAIAQHVVLPSLLPAYLLQDGCEQLPTHAVREIGLKFEVSDGPSLAEVFAINLMAAAFFHADGTEEVDQQQSSKSIQQAINQ